MNIKKEGIGISSPQPTEQFELDFDKIKTVDDCVLVLKAIMFALNSGYDPKIYVNNTYTYYEEIKHLAKDDSVREI